jgi:hypothetical protein
MSKTIAVVDLPPLSSMRDSRDRIDLFTEDLSGGEYLKADRTLYHPGDTAAAHHHADCEHIFFVLAASGSLHLDGSPTRGTAGDVILSRRTKSTRSRTTPTRPSSSSNCGCQLRPTRSSSRSPTTNERGPPKREFTPPRPSATPPPLTDQEGLPWQPK